MPQIKIAIGRMDTEQDLSSKDDAVTSHLYNSYRVGNSIKSIPGLLEWCDLEIGNISIDGDYYSTLHNIRIVIAGGRGWRISPDGNKTEITGIIVHEGTPVSFTEDKDAIYFAANSRIHKYSGGNTATEIAGEAPVNVRSVAFISGFLVAAGFDSVGAPIQGDVWFSDSDGYTEWEVFNAEAVPDAVQSVFVTYSELYAIGRESVEVNYLSGDPNNPFAVNKGVSQPFGTPAPYSVAFDQQSIYYLTIIGGARRIAKLIGGRQPQIISFAVDIPIDEVQDVSTARAWMHSIDGQSFYVITFPTANVTIGDMVQESLTLAFNIRTEEWYIWGAWFDQQGQYRRYPADTFLYVEPWGKRFVGYNGKIYEVSGNSFPDSVLRPSIRTGWRNWGLTSVQKVCHKYTYDIKRGTSATDIVMQHRWRDNNNLEWRNSREISLGAVGNRAIPKESYRCGMYYKRQDEFIFPAGVEMVFNGIEEDWSRLK